MTVATVSPLRATAMTPEPPAAYRRMPAELAVIRHLRVQVRALHQGERALRAGEDAVHDTRVAVRRIRSLLRLLHPFLDRAAADHLDAECSWYADVLGAPRDLEVQRARLAEWLDDLPDTQVLGPVRAQVDERLLGDELRARTALTEVLDSERYAALLVELGEWALRPRWTAEMSTKALRKRVAAAARSARHRWSSAVHPRKSEMSAEVVDLELHRARKAAKRARYAAELMGTVEQPRRNKRSARAFEDLQDVLGDHQDAVVGRGLTLLLGADTAGHGDRNGFTFGLLHARFDQLAQRSRRRARHWSPA
jgi:CHAD domain-containing protein